MTQIKKAGLWIDHRKGVIVTLIGNEIETHQIESNLQRHGPISSGPSGVGYSEDIRDRRFANSLSRFYEEVIVAIRDVESILIMGPGKAKGELVRLMELDKLGGRIVGLETVDKMTDRQIAEKVRQQFQVE